MSAGPSGLPYKRRSGADPPQDVDWDELDRELAGIDPAFADPRFESFPHVLAVLTAINPEEELQKLRERKDALDALVDRVVEVYYSGFNKSLQNYSQILRLFSESRAQLDTLRRSLEESRRQLSVRPTLLRELYQRDLMLGDIERLLDDAISVMGVPEKVQELQRNGEWSLAVAALLDGCNKAARQELSQVAALRQVRPELGRCRAELQGALVAELERRTYRTPRGGSGTAHSPPREGRLAAGGGGGGGGGGGLHPLRAAPSFAGPTPLAGDVDAMASGAMTSHAAHRRSATCPVVGLAPLPLATPLDGGVSDAGGHLYSPEAPLPTLVDCVAQLGGVPATLQAVRVHMPAQMRAAIVAALESFPRERWLPEDGGAGGLPAGTAPAVAQALLEHVFHACTATFHAVARLLQLLALARSPRASAGLEMLLAMEGPEQSAVSGRPPSLEQPLGPAAAAAECGLAWECLQMECQVLVAAVLDAPPPARHPQRVGATADLPGAGWLASVGDAEAAELVDDSPSAAAAAQAAPSNLEPPGTLQFSLEQEAGELLAPAAAGPAAGGAAPSAAAPGDLKPLVARLLGGHPGGAHLVTTTYGPVARFTQAVERLLAGLDDSGSGPATPNGGGARDGRARLSSLLQLQVPWRAATAAVGDADASAAGAVAHGRALLRPYLDSYLRMEFLPAVYVDFRARCSAVLNDGEAFKPRARLRGPYQPEGALLPAAAAAAGMAEDLLRWAAQVAPIAAHLAGVLENVLGRVLDAFYSHVADAAAGSVAGRLAERMQVVQLMAKEPAAALLGSPTAFQVGRSAEPVESFVSSAITAGFAVGEGGADAEREVVRKLLGERPVAPAALLSSAAGDARRLVALATLAESADYVADAIQCSALAAAADAVEGGSGSSGSPARGDRWQRQLAGRLRLWRARPGRDSGGITDGLSHTADRYRALAGQCARTLRLDLLLTLVHHLGGLPCLGPGGPEAAEAEERAAALASTLTRLDDELAAYLSPDKRAYVFGGLPAAAVLVAVALLPEFAVVESGAVARVCRVLSTLQPVLCVVGGCGAGRRPDGARQLEKAKLYYSLLTRSPDSLITAAEHKPHRFSVQEYSALLAANVSGRKVTPEHRQRLQQALKAAALTRRRGRGAAGAPVGEAPDAAEQPV